MKLYEMANFIRKIINISIVVVIFISTYLYIQPIASNFLQSFTPEKPPEIPFKVSKVNFTQDSSFNFSLGNAKITYLGNPETQWQNLSTKKLKVYEYNFSSFEDIDYTPRAKQIALQLGYDDLNQRDNADVSNKYVWVKSGVLFEIDKINKKMIQIPQQGSFSTFKQYLSSGNFISNESPKQYINSFLITTNRFNEQELKDIEMEPQFLRFENNNLIESNSIASELSYVKVFRKLSNLKVVAKRYDFPQIYFYVSSLRPEIENSYKNYRFIHFKLNKIDYKLSYNGFEFDLNPLQNVVNDLKQGKFVISDAKFTGETFGATPNPSQFKVSSITFDSYELGYYDNYEDTVKNDNLQPIYIFKGSIELDSGARGRVTVYTPAIDPRFFN